MRLGLIARCDSRGLGIQTWEFYKHMNPAKTLVVNVPSEQPLRLHPERFPDAVTINGWPQPEDFAKFLSGLDCVYTAETPYGHSLFSIAKQLGVKSVLHVNPEFLDQLDHPELPAPSVYACPSSWMFNKIPDPKVLLPFPVATERFIEPNSAVEATNFLHIVGRPAIHDRNGTESLLDALQYVQADITVTICCQQAGYVEQLLRTRAVPDNVTVRVNSGDVENYWSNYYDQHVLVQPRRFGGLCLPMQEALAAGIPVIMTNVSPNGDRLPEPWLAHANVKHDVDLVCRGHRIDVHAAVPRDLAQKIDKFHYDRKFFAEAKAIALALADAISWESLKPRYDQLFGA